MTRPSNDYCEQIVHVDAFAQQVDVCRSANVELVSLGLRRQVRDTTYTRSVSGVRSSQLMLTKSFVPAKGTTFVYQRENVIKTPSLTAGRSSSDHPIIESHTLKRTPDAYIEQIIAVIDALVPGARENTRIPLLQLGADSLTLAEASVKINTLTGVSLSVFDMLDFKTLAGILENTFSSSCQLGSVTCITSV